MIQFNLLPDVKVDYIRSQRLKRSILGIAVIAAAGALFILIMLFLVVDVFQKQHLSGLNTDIKTDSKKLQSINDLNKILTIQNQLNSLPSLHAAKPVTSRLFTYLSQIVPDKVNIAQLSINFDSNTLTVSGTTDALSTVNKFTDTLKFTGYGTGIDKGGWASATTYNLGDKVTHSGTIYYAIESNTAAQANEPGVGSSWSKQWSTDPPKAFSSVVLTTFGRSDKEATYGISASFDPAIFNSAQAVKLIVPNIITTRSETEKPADLFRQPVNTTSSNTSNTNSQTSQ